MEQSKWQITENLLETNGSKASLYLTKLYNGEPSSEFIADFENPERANEVCNKLNEYSSLKAKSERYEAALNDIAMQKTCAETESDEDIPVGSDGKRMGDIEVGYDCCIERAREALSAGEGEKESKVAEEKPEVCGNCGSPASNYIGNQYYLCDDCMNESENL